MITSDSFKCSKARWDESIISEIHLFEIGDENVEFLAVGLEDHYVPVDL